MYWAYHVFVNYRVDQRWEPPVIGAYVRKELGKEAL